MEKRIEMDLAERDTGSGSGRQPGRPSLVPQRQRLSIYDQGVPRQAGRSRDDTEYVPGGQMY